MPRRGGATLRGDTGPRLSPPLALGPPDRREQALSLCGRGGLRLPHCGVSLDFPACSLPPSWPPAPHLNTPSPSWGRTHSAQLWAPRRLLLLVCPLGQSARGTPAQEHTCRPPSPAGPRHTQPSGKPSTFVAPSPQEPPDPQPSPSHSPRALQGWGQTLEPSKCPSADTCHRPQPPHSRGSASGGGPSPLQLPGCSPVPCPTEKQLGAVRGGVQRAVRGGCGHPEGLLLRPGGRPRTHRGSSLTEALSSPRFVTSAHFADGQTVGPERRSSSRSAHAAGPDGDSSPALVPPCPVFPDVSLSSGPTSPVPPPPHTLSTATPFQDTPLQLSQCGRAEQQQEPRAFVGASVCSGSIKVPQPGASATRGSQGAPGRCLRWAGEITQSPQRPGQGPEEQPRPHPAGHQEGPGPWSPEGLHPTVTAGRRPLECACPLVRRASVCLYDEFRERGYPRLLGCIQCDHGGLLRPHTVWGWVPCARLEGWGSGPPLEGKAGEAPPTHLTLVHSCLPAGHQLGGRCWAPPPSLTSDQVRRLVSPGVCPSRC